MVADALGFALDAKIDHATRSPWPRRRSTRRSGRSSPGLVAAQRFTWQATVRGEPVMTAT